MTEHDFLLLKEGDAGLEPGNRKGMKGRTNLELAKECFLAYLNTRIQNSNREEESDYQMELPSEAG